MQSSECVRAVIIQNGKILLIKRNKYGEEYYTLPGGHIESGESEIQAVKRELLEETSLIITACKKVFIEGANNGYEPQHIFVCEVDGSAVQLSPDSDEAKLNVGGQNTYYPGWYAVTTLPSLPFRTTRLASAIMSAQTEGWPDVVVDLTSDIK